MTIFARAPRLLAVALCALMLTLAARAEDKAKVIAAAEAKMHIDEVGTVEMTVRLAKDVPDKVCYLDSEEDYKDPKNVAVLIDAKDREAFQKAGIAKPAEFYKGKVIRVTGTLILESKQVRMHVEDPKQIEVVGKKD